MRAEVHVMAANPEGRPENDFVEDSGARVHEQLRASGRTHDAPDIACIHLYDGNRALFAQKAASTIEVAVAAGDLVPLPRKQVCKIRAGRSGPQDEDAHW